MWTPKRIVLLVMGFALFCTGYFTYSFVLGGIDGLPPLPEAFLQPLPDDPTFTFPEFKPTQVEEKLRQAFGLECPESKRPIKIQIARNGMVIAADRFHFDDEGRLVLEPFSVALFGKPKPGEKEVEINTIRANIGKLKFDRPVKTVNPNELNGRKITGAELVGNIEVVNNRHTAARDDDLELFIPTGPLYYEESTHLVWTYDTVHVTDRSSKPKPHEVCGKGMEMELLAEATPGNKPHQDSITGVKRITLQSNVDMHLYIDGQSSFMGKPGEKKNAASPKVVERVTTALPVTAPPTPATPVEPDKSLIHITTPGRFVYLLFKDYDTAHFEVTPGTPPAAPPVGSQDVKVLRFNEKLKTCDQLFCEKLDLRLTRNNPKPADKNAKPADKNAKPAGSDSADQNITIETADAFGKRVTLTSDAENFSATEVVELHHNAKWKTTVLKGNPCLVAEKSGSTLYTPQIFIEELTIAGTEKTYQKVTAAGPGSIDMLDEKTKTKHQHAYWNDALVSLKDEHAKTPDGELQDLLILTGKARFVDDVQSQTLKADTLKVWMAPGDKTVEKSTPAQPTSVGQPGGPRVQHIEGTNNVSAESTELNIHDTSRLVVWFKDAPPGALPTQKQLETKRLPVADPLPPLPSPALGSEGSHLPPVANTPQPGNGAVQPVPFPAPAAVASTPPPKKEEPPRPIDLSARSVEAYVLRDGQKNNLDHLFTEGNVHVRQAPAKEGDKGVDIRGETLTMFAYPEGKLLTVTGGNVGNEDNLAKLLMDKILIIGPEVNIDQVQNKVWVTGPGMMRIDSTTTLSNKPLDKSIPLDIMWQKSMLIWGRNGEFNSGIQATQEEGRLTCNDLRVTFDKPISLKEGPREDKGDQPKVQTLLCDKDAWVEDKTFVGEKLTKLQRLFGPVLELEALEGDNENAKPEEKKDPGHQIRVSGRGFLKIWQLSGEDPLTPSPKVNPTGAPPKVAPIAETSAKPPAPGAAPKPGAGSKPGAKPEEPQPKMTLITFGSSMYANSHTNFASFFKNVRVLSMPTDNPFIDVGDPEIFIDVELSPRLKPGSLYLTCNHLEVRTRQENGKTYQEMYAREQAVVQGPDYWGRAETIHFDELKDQIIFEGGPGSVATLVRFKATGEQGQPLKGKKIIYNRTTGQLHIDGTTSIEAN